MAPRTRRWNTWYSRSDRRVRRPFGVRHRGERELLGDLGADERTAAGDLANRGQELGGGAVLGQVSGRAGLDARTAY